MGFQIMIEIEAGGTSSKVSQLDEDGKVGAQIGGPGSFNQSNVDATSVMRGKLPGGSSTRTSAG